MGWSACAVKGIRSKVGAIPTGNWFVPPGSNRSSSGGIDAQAIAEAVGRPTMRFVPIKTDDQLDMQPSH
jgi:hypothetical protein